MNPTSPRPQSKGTIGKVMISVDEHPDTLSPSDKSVLWPTNEGGGVIGGSGQIKLNRIKKLFEQQQQNLDRTMTNPLNKTLPKTSYGRKGGVGGGFQNLPLLSKPSHGEVFSDCKSSLSQINIEVKRVHEKASQRLQRMDAIQPLRFHEVRLTITHALQSQSTHRIQTQDEGALTAHALSPSTKRCIFRLQGCCEKQAELLERERVLKEKNAELFAANGKLNMELNEMKATNKLLAEQAIKDGTIQNIDMERIGLHNLYQDLFLTDLKKEVLEANLETQQKMTEMGRMRKELNDFRKENRELQNRLKSYRALVSRKVERKQSKANDGRVSSPLTDYSAEPVEELQKIELMKGVSSMDTTEIMRGLKESPSGNSSPLYRRSPSRASHTVSLKLETLDILQLEIMLNSLKRLARCETIGSLISTTFEEIKSFLNCQRAMIFFTDPIIAKRYNLEVPGNTQTVQVNKEWFDVVLPNWLTGEAVDVAPAFKNRAQLRAGIKKKHVLSLPVSYSNWSRSSKEVEKSYKEIHFAVQLEGRLTRSGGASAFKTQDEMVVSLLCTFLSSTIERIISKENLEKDRTRSSNLLATCRDLVTARDHLYLFVSLKYDLPKLLGFERAGILFTDITSQEFYIINEQKGMEGGLYTGNTIQVPSKIGITGIAREKKEIQVVPLGKNDHRFNTDVDNLTGHSDIKNLVILPLLSQNQEVVGVAQFINKLDGEFSQDFVTSMKFLGPILGAIICNTNEHVKVCNISIGLKHNIQSITGVFEDRTNWLASLAEAAFAQQINQKMQKVHLLLSDLIQSKKLQYFKHRSMIF